MKKINVQEYYSNIMRITTGNFHLPIKEMEDLIMKLLLEGRNVRICQPRVSLINLNRELFPIRVRL